MFHERHPTVVHDLHEAVPLLMSWNGTGPYNPNIDPVTYSEFLALSFYEVQTMTGLGMPGVSTGILEKASRTCTSIRLP